MSEKKKSPFSLLPKVELLIILVFFVSFLVWAVSRCNATRDRYQAEMEEAATEESPAATSPDTAATKPPPPQPAAPPAERLSRLYITVDNTNLREKPTLDSEVLDQLDLFDEVYFLNEVTDFTEEVNLGKEVTDEPWVKVRSEKGKEGWVYGACVHYYKYKHPGAQ